MNAIYMVDIECLHCIFFMSINYENEPSGASDVFSSKTNSSKIQCVINTPNSSRLTKIVFGSSIALFSILFLSSYSYKLYSEKQEIIDLKKSEIDQIKSARMMSQEKIKEVEIKIKNQEEKTREEEQQRLQLEEKTKSQRLLAQRSTPELVENTFKPETLVKNSLQIHSKAFSYRRQFIDIGWSSRRYWTSQIPKNSVILTFDDGPSNKYTTKILDILKKYNVKATFFVVGQRVEQRCDLVKRIVSEGHELANHSYSHPFLWKNRIKDQTEQIKKTQNAIKNCVGDSHVPNWFRAPYAAQDETTIKAAHDLGLNTVLWNIDTNDWQKTSTVESIASEALKSQGQDIILMHDATEANQNFKSPKASDSRQNTVDALDEIITKFQKRGVQFTTLSDAFGISKQNYFVEGVGSMDRENLDRG